MTFWSNLNSRTGRYLLLALAAVALLAGLNFCELQSGDETRTAGISAEMFIDGDYLVPRLNGEPFLEYPPLYYWCGAAAYSVFGINDFAAKLPSALAAIGCVLLLFEFAGKLGLPVWARFFSGFFLLTGAQFFSNSRVCRVDMLLAFFILLTIFAFYAAMLARSGKGRWGFRALFLFGLTAGIYTKGLLGFGLPVSVLGSWLVLGDCLNRRVSWRGYFTLGFGTVFAFALAGIWYWLLLRHGGREMFDTAFFVNNFGRFSGSQGDHVESFFYYFIKLPSLFLPWLPLLPFALWAALPKIRLTRDSGLLLCVVFLLVPFCILCVASSKRVVYLLPFYAPCALLCGWYLTALPERVRQTLPRYLERLPLASARRVWCAVLLFGLLLAGVGTGISLLAAPKNSLRPLFEVCAKLEKQGVRVVLLNAPERTQGAAFFYLHHRLDVVAPDSVPAVPGEYGVLRRKSDSIPGERFADSHLLVKR